MWELISESRVAAPPRYQSFCKNCGAPEEPGHCSYCLTPSPPRIDLLYGWMCLRPEVVVRMDTDKPATWRIRLGGHLIGRWAANMKVSNG